MNFIDTLVLQGGLGITTAIIYMLFLQERKERREAQAENKALTKLYNDHLKEDIQDKIADREALKQAIEIVKGVGKE